MYKILIVGERFCGKTSLVQRYVSNAFSTKYRATVSLKLIQCCADLSRSRQEFFADLHSPKNCVSFELRAA
jgi:GTPase SAR1 family protein